MSTTYLAKGYPFPMPVLTVRFRRLADPTASAPQVAIVDTGADRTMAPAAILTDLQAQELQETNLISQWGDAHPVILCLGSIGTQGLSGKSSGKVAPNGGGPLGAVDRTILSNLP